MKGQSLFSGKNKKMTRKYFASLLSGKKFFSIFAKGFIYMGRKLFSAGVFVLKFYDPVNPMGSCRAGSVNLTTCLLGRLSPVSG